jgi:hypothetical protein
VRALALLALLTGCGGGAYTATVAACDQVENQIAASNSPLMEARLACVEMTCTEVLRAIDPEATEELE